MTATPDSVPNHRRTTPFAAIAERPTLSILLASLLLIIYVGFLVISNYQSQVALQESATNRFQLDLEKRAAALGYFFSERKYDLSGLALSPEINSYFTNKSLGMSEQYGLKVNLFMIDQLLQNTLEDVNIQGDKIYDRFVLLDNTGRVLSDTASKSATQPVQVPSIWKKETGDEPNVYFVDADDKPQILLATSCFYKGKIVGELIVQLARETLFSHFIDLMDTLALSGSGLLDENGRLHLSNRINDQDFSALLTSKQFTGLSNNGVAFLPFISENKKHDMLIARFPIHGLHLSYVVWIPREELSGGLVPWRLVIGAVTLAVFVLASLGSILWYSGQNLILKARFDESEHQQDLLAAKNKQLETEIKKREASEEKLQKSKDEWENTFNALSDIVSIQDRDMRIIRANTAAYEAFHVEPGALSGKYCYEVFREANQPCFNCPELSTLKERSTHTANITHKNLGKIFHVTSSPVLDDHGDLTHIVHIAKDITEQKNMEDELFQAHKMEAIGTLAGGIAHDFNNILAAIIGYADMARDDIPEWSPSRNNIEQVLKAGGRAKELVRQILTFSRKGPEIQQPMQPSSIIKEGLKLMRASLPTTIEIQKDIASDCGLILANPTNIHQVLVNLCTNAFHAMENEKGVLTVKLTRVDLQEAYVKTEAAISSGSFVELMVSDTGCGMDEATVERIFEPYFTTKEVGKGSGMGLALVHGIVQGCGGFMRVESNPGNGSTFHVYFPAFDEKVMVEVKEEKQEPLPTGNERILAIDDEEDIVGLFQATLENLGYKVFAYCNSEKALDLFQATPANFDLIITDQTMPHLSGAELAKKILQIRPDIPIIMCTGYSSMISEEKAKEIGVERFIMKPVRRRDLAETVREVLDNKKPQST